MKRTAKIKTAIYSFKHFTFAVTSLCEITCACAGVAAVKCQLCKVLYLCFACLVEFMAWTLPKAAV